MKVKDDVHFKINPTLRIRLDSEARTAGKTLRRTKIDVTKHADLVRAIAQLLDGQPIEKLSSEELSFMVANRILIRPDQVPRKIKPRFEMNTRTLTFIAVSVREEAKKSLLREELQLNHQNVFIQKGAARPVTPFPGIPPRDDFPKSKQLIWVYDPGTRMWAVYHSDSHTLKLVEKIISHPKMIGKLTLNQRELLYHARILVTKKFVKEREQHWKHHLPKLRNDVHRNGYAILQDLITPLQVAALKKYAKSLEHQGYLELDTVQVRNKRYLNQDDPLCLFIHLQTGNAIRQMTGELVIPSWCALCSYLPGAKLAKHIDKPVCIWNLSMMIDSFPETNPSKNWPLCFEHRGKRHEVQSSPGDAIIYKGTETPHDRPSLPSNYRQTLGLFFYVSIQYSGSYPHRRAFA